MLECTGLIPCRPRSVLDRIFDDGRCKTTTLHLIERMTSEVAPADRRWRIRSSRNVQWRASSADWRRRSRSVIDEPSPPWGMGGNRRELSATALISRVRVRACSALEPDVQRTCKLKIPDACFCLHVIERRRVCGRTQHRRNAREHHTRLRAKAPQHGNEDGETEHFSSLAAFSEGV
jgi:hypothetical protein